MHSEVAVFSVPVINCLRRKNQRGGEGEEIFSSGLVASFAGVSCSTVSPLNGKEELCSKDVVQSSLVFLNFVKPVMKCLHFAFFLIFASH